MQKRKVSTTGQFGSQRGRFQERPVSAVGSGIAEQELYARLHHRVASQNPHATPEYKAEQLAKLFEERRKQLPKI